MAETVAEVIVRTLYSLGVRRFYGIPGDSLNPLMDALRRNREMQFVQVRHEEGAAIEASFEAKYTGRPAVCIGTSGPGSIHLLNGLYDAKMDHAPVIAFTGQIETDLLGTDYFQEVRTVKLFDDVSVFNTEIVDPENVQKIVVRAYREALYHRGVSHISLPVNVLREQAREEKVYMSPYLPEVHYSADFSAAVEMIDRSEKPVIFIGRGASGQTQAIMDLSERIGAPVIYAVNGKGIVDDSDPRVMGSLGLLGTRPSVEAMKRCDLMILLGTSFPYVSFYPDGVDSIQVDTDPSNIGKRVVPKVSYVASVEDFLGIRNKVREKKDKFYRELQDSKRDWISYLEKMEGDGSKPIRPERLAATVNRYAPRDAVVVVDTGNVTVWSVRNMRTPPGRTFFFSAWLGSMGVGIPGSIGISFATDRPIVAMIGDGSFAMTMMELITAKKYERPVKLVVFNNSKLGMIKFEEQVMGYPEFGVDLYNPDFSQVARAVGIESRRVEEPGDLDGAVKDMFASRGPFVLDVIVDPDERPMPPKLTFAQVKGYITSILREKLEPE
ncbi:pyruvate oxidase [Thermogymnomonas acidicola]|uniref:Pyruvate oxidase n=1 Tax=Thermogymnomonas acidicola TaxID=399579 RepID=A0AA37BQC0_9ARCH|nr:thiamine pyrophosphate-dependent enzyme [Thermogymnomonas acidicola]GGM69033.1 pyruvate oxidase [Thermogymnomonas acidicola]